MPDAERNADDWDNEIVPRRSYFKIPWRDLWRYRDLMRLLARRDLTAQYKQTVLGPFWFVIQPLLATFAFSFLFGRLAGLGTEGVPHFLFYMAGLISWNYFSECINKTAFTFTKNANLFSKVYFPRLAAPLATLGVNLATYALQFLIFLGGIAFYWWKLHYAPDPMHPIHLSPNWRVVMLPVLLVQMTMLGLGIGLVISALTTKYRDLALGVGFIVQLWMYASSVVFPLSKIAEPHLQKLLALNPMVPVIEMMRYSFLGYGTVSRLQLGVSFGLSVAVLLVGVLMFNRAEQTAMDAV